MATTPTAATPQITPPYGFQDVIALNKTHRVLLPKGQAVPTIVNLDRVMFFGAPSESLM